MTTKERKLCQWIILRKHMICLLRSIYLFINGKTAGFSNKQLFLEVQKTNMISVILTI